MKWLALLAHSEEGALGGAWLHGAVLVQVDDDKAMLVRFEGSTALLVSGGENAVVQLWDTVKVSAALSTLRTHTGAVTSLTFSPVNELLLCSAGTDAQIVFYDINQSKSIKALKCPSP